MSCPSLMLPWEPLYKGRGVLPRQLCTLKLGCLVGTICRTASNPPLFSPGYTVSHT